MDSPTCFDHGRSNFAERFVVKKYAFAKERVI